MIKQTEIVNEMIGDGTCIQYLNVEFTDGTFVNLNEEELKNAAALAGEGLLMDSSEVEYERQQVLKFTPPEEDDKQLGAFENEGGSTYSEQMQSDLEPIEPAEQDYHEQALLEKMEDEDES